MPAPLRPEVRARLRAAVIERVLPRFGNDPDRQQSAAANALKVHPSAINRLVKQGSGGSVQMIEQVEKLLNEPPGTILGYSTGQPTPRFRDLDGFAAVVEEAARRARDNRIQLTRKDLENAGDYRLSPPPQRITPELLIQVALALGPEDPQVAVINKRSPRKK